MSDVTPLIGTDAKVIQTYTNRGFRISGDDYLGALVVAGDKVMPLAAKSAPELRPPHLSMLEGIDVKYLIVGCAPVVMLDAALISGMKTKGIVVEVMDLGAACRTYNVLRAEGRQIAAALIPAGPPPDKK